MSLVLSVDPGLTGAYSVMTEQGHLLALDDLPIMRDGGLGWVDAPTLASKLFEVKQGQHMRAIVERVHAMPKNGSQAAFSQGCTFASILATLQIVGASIEFVPPQTWKKFCGLIDSTKTDGERKRASLDKARLLWPGASLDRVKDHGRAEALLIAHWYINTKLARAAA